MQLETAKQIAVKYCYQIQPFCIGKRINIAGSIRRMKREVKDIEICAIAKTQEVKDLFGVKTGEIKNASFIHTVNSFGKVIKGTPMGKMMQIELPEGIMLDLFMPDEHDYFRQFAIRTGSADYSFKVIANGWKKLGWVGSDKGLRLMSDCIEMKGPDGKSKWKCLNKNAEKPPVWESEEDFFKWIKVPFVHPSKRYVK